MNNELYKYAAEGSGSHSIITNGLGVVGWSG